MILVGCAIVTLAMVGLFSSNDTQHRSVSNDEGSVADRWINKYAVHLMRAIAIVLGLMFVYGAYLYADAPVVETRAFTNWQRSLFFSYVMVFLSLFYLSTFEKWAKKYAAHLLRVIFIAVALLWIHGVYFYPDAPIFKCGDGYCGKQHQAHTRAEFSAFYEWQSFYFLAFSFGFLTLCYLKRKIPADRKAG